MTSSDAGAAVEQMGAPAGKQSPLLGPPCRNPNFPQSCGGTALWHGLYYTAKELKPVAGRKAIAVSGTVKAVDEGTKTVVVKTADRTEHTFHFVGRTVAHGGEAAAHGSKDAFEGMKEGDEVLVTPDVELSALRFLHRKPRIHQIQFPFQLPQHLVVNLVLGA